ncbi:MAG: hypothetical protein FD149_878 [Rhodospirillaceae bacterium]|nr:MAG: hypothetical protein FD149_878 [Rhodospirillaceae bacterium]
MNGGASTYDTTNLGGSSVNFAVKLSADDITTLNLGGTTAWDTLDRKVAILKAATGSTLMLSVAAATKFEAGTFTTPDVLKIKDTAANIQTLLANPNLVKALISPASTSPLSTSSTPGVKSIWVDSGEALGLSVAAIGTLSATLLTSFDMEFAAIAASTLINVEDTVANLQTLDGTTLPSVDTLRILGVSSFVLKDSAANIKNTSADALENLGVDRIIVALNGTTGNAENLPVSVGQMAVLINYDISFATPASCSAGTIVLTDTLANVLAAQDVQFKSFVATTTTSTMVIDLTDTSPTLSASKAIALKALGLSFLAADTVTITHEGLESFLPDTSLGGTIFADLKAMGIDGVNFSGATAVTLTIAQVLNLQATPVAGGFAVTGADKIVIVDTQNNFSALSATNIQNLGTEAGVTTGLGVISIRVVADIATSGVAESEAVLTLAQAVAMGTYGMAPDGTQVGWVQDTASALTGLAGTDVVANLKLAGVTKLSVTGADDAFISYTTATALAAATAIANTDITGTGNGGKIWVADTALALQALHTGSALADLDSVIANGYTDLVIKDSEAVLQFLLSGKDYIDAPDSPSTVVLSEFAASTTGSLRLESTTAVTGGTTITLTPAQAGAMVAGQLTTNGVSFVSKSTQKVIVDVTNVGLTDATDTDDVTSSTTFWSTQGVTHAKFTADGNSVIALTTDGMQTLIANGIKIEKGTTEKVKLTGRVTELTAFAAAVTTLNTNSDPVDLALFNIDSVTVTDSNPGDPLLLTIAEVEAFARNTIVLDPTLNVTVSVDWADYTPPTPDGQTPALGERAKFSDVLILKKLAAINVDQVVIINAATNPVAFSVAQAKAILSSGIDVMLGVDVAENAGSGDGVADIGTDGTPDSYTGNGKITIADIGTSIALLTKGQIAALAGLDITSIDLTDGINGAGTVILAADRAAAMGANDITFTDPGDTVTVRDTSAALAALSVAQIAKIAKTGVKELDSRTDTATVSVAQAQAMIINGLSYEADDVVTLTDTAAHLQSGLPPRPYGGRGRGYGNDHLLV